jgi:chaperonin GroES
MKFRPLQDRVLIRRIEEEEKTAGGIIIPDTAKEKPMEGELVAAGPGTRGDDGKLHPLDVKVGDRVLFGNGTARSSTVGRLTGSPGSNRPADTSAYSRKLATQSACSC